MRTSLRLRHGHGDKKGYRNGRLLNSDLEGQSIPTSPPSRCHRDWDYLRVMGETFGKRDDLGMDTLPRQPNSGQTVTKMRVIKKLDPADRGAIKLRQQFGDALVCVRHRVDSAARIRYTTVELLVDRAEIQPRAPELVAVRIHPGEYGLRTVVRAAGAL